MPSIQKLCDRMRYWCDQGNLGYDQGQRWNIYEGGECDCSSLVYWCLWEAGFLDQKPTWGNTATLWNSLKNRGWQRISPNGHPRKGDILLNDSNHVALMISDSLLGQASIDENGNIAGGKAGDQSGWETNTRDYYDYPWNCYLRYVGSDSGASESPSSTSSASAGIEEVRYRASVDPDGKKWLNEYVGFTSPHDNDGFVGIKGQPMRWLAMKFPGWYQVKTEKNGWLGKIRAYDVNDLEDGCAGDGSPIIAIRCYYETQNPSKTGYHVIEYQAGIVGGSWLGYLHDLKCVDGDPDDFAGDGKPIDRFKARIVKL